MIIRCKTKRRIVNLNGKLFVFNLGDELYMPEEARTLANTQFFEIVEEEQKEEKGEIT